MAVRVDVIANNAGFNDAECGGAPVLVIMRAVARTHPSSGQARFYLCFATASSLLATQGQRSRSVSDVSYVALST